MHARHEESEVTEITMDRRSIDFPDFKYFECLICNHLGLRIYFAQLSPLTSWLPIASSCYDNSNPFIVTFQENKTLATTGKEKEDQVE